MEETDSKTDENSVYIVIKNASKPSIQRYKTRSIKCMSIVHLICGAVTFWLDLAKIFIIADSDENALAGFCSSLFIITGIVGFISLKATNKCKISAFLVLSIMSSIFGGFFCFSNLFLLLEYSMEGRAIYLSFFICGLMELILGIVSSAYGCHACCSCCGGALGTSEENSVVYVSAPVEEDVGKPRVVHLDMKEIRKKQVNDKQIVLGTVDNTEDNFQYANEEEDNSKGYVRFK
eukprot:GFUD01005992.1.p1 GENE.GFUD01005992.1~~GFUD01005992.1.p1  ORF type:complete len:234 (+),score=20.38 GFUD01005992.1:156-857(+)